MYIPCWMRTDITMKWTRRSNKRACVCVCLYSLLYMSWSHKEIDKYIHLGLVNAPWQQHAKITRRSWEGLCAYSLLTLYWNHNEIVKEIHRGLLCTVLPEYVYTTSWNSQGDPQRMSVRIPYPRCPQIIMKQARGSTEDFWEYCIYSMDFCILLFD